MMLAATPAMAAVQTFTARDSFTAASDILTVQPFNSAKTEQSFQNSPVTFSDLSVQGFGDQIDRNFVDRQPLQFSQFNVDGTTVLNAITTPTGGLTFTFAHPITAFGADLASFQDDQVRSQIVAAGATFTPPVQVTQATKYFFGFTSTNAFTTVTFKTAGNGVNDGFGIDNVTYGQGSVSSAVPEPASWALALLGLGVAGGMYRRRRAQGTLRLA